MTDFKKKYLKYKKKYIDLKNQFGGLDLSEWRSIPNAGQRNCGIFINDKEPHKIIKCTSEKTDIEHINSLEVFPRVYENPIINANSYIVMEKLDGDYTSLFFNIIPNIVLNEMKLSEKIKSELLYIFNSKIPKTHGSKSVRINTLEFRYFHEADFNKKIEEAFKSVKKVSRFDYSDICIDEICYKNSHDSYKTFKEYIDNDEEYSSKSRYNKLLEISKKINEFEPLINIKLYDTFMNKIFEKIDEIYPIVMKEIIKIKIKLMNKNYYYNDNKFDNFGFSFKDITDEEEYPIIFGKKIKTYILDWESGLSKISDVDYNNYEYHIENLIDEYNKGVNYAINGQYNLSNFNEKLIYCNDIINNSENYEFVDETDKIINLFFSENMKEIINKTYEYSIKLPKPINNVEELK
jgi:hypothetical protein